VPPDRALGPRNAVHKTEPERSASALAPAVHGNAGRYRRPALTVPQTWAVAVPGSGTVTSTGSPWTDTPHTDRGRYAQNARAGTTPGGCECDRCAAATSAQVAADP